MPYESPISVLYSPEGTEVAVSSSVQLQESTPGFLIFGSGSTGARTLSFDSNGALIVSGNFSATSTPVATQSVRIDGWDNGVTGSVYATLLGNSLVTAVVQNTASVFVVNTNPLDVNLANTASVNVQNTASVLLAPSIGTLITSALANQTSYTILPARPSRRGATFYKEGSNICFLALADTASSTAYTVRLSNNGYFELPFEYVGPISVVFNTDDTQSAVRVTEITASL